MFGVFHNDNDYCLYTWVLVQCMGNSELIIHSIVTCNLHAWKTLLSLISYIYEGVSCKHVTRWGNSQIIDEPPKRQLGYIRQYANWNSSQLKKRLLLWSFHPDSVCFWSIYGLGLSVVLCTTSYHFQVTTVLLNLVSLSLHLKQMLASI